MPGQSHRDDAWSGAADGEDAGFDPEAFDHPLAALQVGSRVRHEEYGDGVVTGLRGRLGGLDRKVVVLFPSAGSRQFILRHARLELLDAADDV